MKDLNYLKLNDKYYYLNDYYFQFQLILKNKIYVVKKKIQNFLENLLNLNLHFLNYFSSKRILIKKLFLLFF